MYFDPKEIKTKQDLINAFNEITSYRSLDGEDFDFGTGLIVNESSFGSEDGYYEMDTQYLLDLIENFDYESRNFVRRNKHRLTKRDRIEKERNHIEKLSRISWSAVHDRDVWKKRCYRGSRSSFFKKVSNKSVRRYKGELHNKGGSYKKIFDLWNIIY